jgi:uncharacterized membrane protein
MSLPPLHPILVNFTAALVPVSVASDVLGRILRRRSLHVVGWWTLLYAAVVTPFTALAGWLWVRSMGDMDMPQMTVHKWLGTLLAVVFVGLVFWRWHIHHHEDGVPSWLYLMCAAVVVVALVLQGHLGGSMSFGAANESTSPDRTSTPHNTSPDHGDDHGPQWRDHIDLKDKQ